MKLRKSESVSVLDYQRIDIRHINTRFDDCCTNKHINVALYQIPPNIAQLILGHLTVGNGNIRFGQKILEL